MVAQPHSWRGDSMAESPNLNFQALAKDHYLSVKPDALG